MPWRNVFVCVYSDVLLVVVAVSCSFLNESRAEHCSGINMYAMLTGRLPFNSSNVTTLHALMLDQKFDMPENLSEGVHVCVGSACPARVCVPETRV